MLPEVGLDLSIRVAVLRQSLNSPTLPIREAFPTRTSPDPTKMPPRADPLNGRPVDSHSVTTVAANIQASTQRTRLTNWLQVRDFLVMLIAPHFRFPL